MGGIPTAESCPVLLATVSGRSSDAAGVRGDSASDLDSAVACWLGVRLWKSENLAKKAAGADRCPRNPREPGSIPGCRYRGGDPATISRVVNRQGGENLVATSRREYTATIRKAKMEIPGKGGRICAPSMLVKTFGCRSRTRACGLLTDSTQRRSESDCR